LDTATPDDDLEIKANGALAVITLTRAHAYNAINYEMRAAMSRFFPQIARDPQIYAVVLQSNSEKAFSAGADVREIIARARDDINASRQAFKEEYSLNWQLECFTKPMVSLMDGMVIGSGVGISAYGTHRVGAQKYKFAMPETAIGLFPDVGVAHILSKMPSEMGIYIGLTGRTLKRPDAYALGLLTHCIAASEFDAIRAALSDAQPVDPILDDRHQDPGPGELAQHQETIDRCFSAPTVEDIIESLKGVAADQQDWARKVVADIEKRSPLSLKVTLRHIRCARNMDLRQTLQVDYRLACKFLDGSDFYEGVRAALIDKDGNPSWQPSSLEEVSEQLVDSYFETLGPDELILPLRGEVQTVRR